MVNTPAGEVPGRSVALAGVVGMPLIAPGVNFVNGA